jgi:molybdenum cofactor cytidylyltransferase
VTRAFAIVPACGHSTRMGQPKLALPLGGQTVIERVVSTLRDGGVEHVVVVIGPHVPGLVPLARSAGADVLALDEPTPDMRATVERGLNWFEEQRFPSPDDWWILAPADHPAFPASAVRELLAARSVPHSIIIPTHNGRRGHPALLRWRHAAGIRALPVNVGINAYLRAHATETLKLPVNDPGILANLDTPEDYEHIRPRTVDYQ